MKFSETATKVIDLATSIRDYWNDELPKRHPNYPWIAPGEDSGPPPPEETTLKNLLEKLPDENVYKLLLIMHFGRGDFGTDDLANQYDILKKRFAPPERAVAQLMGKATLADYLADGLDEMKKSGIDIDQLTFSSVTSGS